MLPLLSLVCYGLSFAGKKGFYLCLLLLPFLRLIDACNFGVAFFVVRAAAYIYDEHKEKNFAKVFAFLMFFPTVSAGPVTRYDCIRFDRAADFSLISRGILLLIWGAFEKLFFADTLKRAFDLFHSGGTTLSAFAALIAYSLYIYFDFSGYSNAAIGVCNIFGVALPRNFDFPYMSRSVGEFFRRWHISLGRWLFDYIYLPLGGSKHGKVRMFLSLAAVWTFSALWHGFTLAYLLWGAWFFALSALEKNKIKLGRFGTLGSVALGWVFFFSKTPNDAYKFLLRLFSAGNTLLYSRADIYNCMRHLPFILLAAFFATPVVHRMFCMLYEKARGLTYIAVIPAMLLVLSCLAAGGHSPFLYASF
ncbi:MAG: MBOAT family protein [Clostridia bacterium]|nr:MBOAT family protein [Clostridia bacterium]